MFFWIGVVENVARLIISGRFHPSERIGQLRIYGHTPERWLQQSVLLDTTKEFVYRDPLFSGVFFVICLKLPWALTQGGLVLLEPG